MPIPKSDYEVVLDVPQWLLKKMAKIDPSPVVGGDGEGVYYVGKFSDTWAPEDLRNREFYYFHAKAILSPDVKTEDVKSQCLSTVSADEGDPLFPSGASLMSEMFFREFCAPKGANANWSNCLDPQFEGTASCYLSSNVGSVDYSKCLIDVSSYYGPYMFIHKAAPVYDSDLDNLVAFSKPCPVYSSSYSLSGASETSGKVLIRAVGCDDSSNRVRYVRYTSEDRNSTTYTIAYLGIGRYTSGNAIEIWMRYGLTSSVVKNANDYYYYIYTVGFQYQ